MRGHWLLVLLTVSILIGCSSKKKAEEQAPPQPAKKLLEGEPIVKFSDVNNLPNSGNRQYRRLTRQRLEEDSEVHAQAGSMWVMDGQGAYLFSQNKARREGDILNIRLDSVAQKQVETKVAVIKKLLKQLEDEEKKAKEQMLKQLQQKDNKATPEAQKLAEAQQPPPPEPDRTPASEENKDEGKIETVPTRVVERQSDGSFRVKGQQPFMIGKREYKVIVTGIVRAEDFNEEGLSSSRLLDPQFDVVSIRKKEL